MATYSIGEVATQINMPTKTIRYYENIGLVTPMREHNGYRVFRQSDLHKLAFLGRSRALGFPIEDCRTLLALWEDKSRASADVRALAKDHLNAIEEKIVNLQDMADTLSNLIDACSGDDRPDCPILNSLDAKPG